MRYRPLYDRILVRPIRNNVTSSGLHVPDIVHDNTPFYRAEVVEVGHGRVTQDGGVVPLKVKRNDTVLFFRYPSEQISVPSEDGDDLMCIRETHVIVLLEGLARDTGLVTPEGTRAVVEIPS